MKKDKNLDALMGVIDDAYIAREVAFRHIVGSVYPKMKFGPWMVSEVKDNDGYSELCVVSEMTSEEIKRKADFPPIICTIADGSKMTEDDLANASLISSTPDLLKAVIEFMDTFEDAIIRNIPAANKALLLKRGELQQAVIACLSTIRPDEWVNVPSVPEFSQEWQKAAMDLAKEKGINARPIKNKRGFDVEFECVDCKDWELDISTDGRCYGCYCLNLNSEK